MNLLWLILTSCNQKEDTGYWNCDNAQEVTYANFGEGFLRHNCQGCHASSTNNRHGAPENVTFDTMEDAWKWKDRILTTTLSNPPTMPPAGKITENQAILLHWWLECGEDLE